MSNCVVNERVNAHMISRITRILHRTSQAYFMTPDLVSTAMDAAASNACTARVVHKLIAEHSLSQDMCVHLYLLTCFSRSQGGSTEPLPTKITKMMSLLDVFIASMMQLSPTEGNFWKEVLPVQGKGDS
eukprot:5301468-Amphidinium_carterae.2